MPSRSTPARSLATKKKDAIDAAPSTPSSRKRGAKGSLEESPISPSPSKRARRGGIEKKSYKEDGSDDEDVDGKSKVPTAVNGASPPKKNKGKAPDEKEDKTSPRKATPKGSSTKRKADTDAPSLEAANASDASPKKKRPRKTAEEKAKEAMPLAARTPISASSKLQHYIGAHVSAAGGVQNAVVNSVQIGGNAFALFLKSQRKWDNPPLKPEQLDGFLSNCKEHKYSAGEHVVPHGSYLVNLAAADKDKADQAYKGFIDDLHRCDALGIKLYNFHPGNTNGLPRQGALGRIAAQLNRAHAETSQTNKVVTLLENMAASPTSNTLGATFDDLKSVIADVKDKTRVGVCIDTCHAFAAGHDIRDAAGLSNTLDEFDKVVGIKYLRALHLNDSKAPLSSHRDLHANIGWGFLGLRAFHAVVNEPRLHGLPMVLETPIDRKDAFGKLIEHKEVWAQEIKLLESLVGMDVDSDEFVNLEKELAAKGASEREKLQTQFDKKVAKDSKSGKKGARGGAKKKNAIADDEDSDDDSDRS